MVDHRSTESGVCGAIGGAKRTPLLQRLRRERNVLFASGFLFLVGLHPILPVLAGGAILAAEFDAGDVSVTHLALLLRIGGEVLQEGFGQRGTGFAIEDKGLDALAALERKRHIAAIVQSLAEGLAQIVLAGQRGNPAFQIFALSTRSQFQRLNLLQRIFQYFGGHAWVSSSSRSGSLICTSATGPRGALSLSSFSACRSRYMLNVPRTMPQNPFSDPNPSITDRKSTRLNSSH